MLRKKYRLQVQFFFKKNHQTKKSAFFAIKVFETTNNYSRLGIIIGKKISQSAVLRNKVKRIIFSFFQENQKSLPQKDFLLIPNSKITHLTKYKIIDDLKKVFNLNK